MKLGILADIHERDDSLRRSIEVLRRHGADCFIVLEHERDKVGAGDMVSVQLMTGLV